MTREEATARRSKPASRPRATWSPPATRCLLTGDMGIANTTASRRADRRVHRRLAGRRSPGTAPASTSRPTRTRSRSSAGRWNCTGPTRRTRSACWPRSAAWSTRRWPASSSARRALRDPGDPRRRDRRRRGAGRPGAGPGRHRGLRRRAPLGRARAPLALDGPGRRPADRPRTAAGRGHRRGPGACRWSGAPCARCATSPRSTSAGVAERLRDDENAACRTPSPADHREPHRCTASRRFQRGVYPVRAAAPGRPAGGRGRRRPGRRSAASPGLLDAGADVAGDRPGRHAGARGAGRRREIVWERRPYQRRRPGRGLVRRGRHRRPGGERRGARARPRPAGCSARGPTRPRTPPRGPRRSGATTASPSAVHRRRRPAPRRGRAATACWRACATAPWPRRTTAAAPRAWRWSAAGPATRT